MGLLDGIAGYLNQTAPQGDPAHMGLFDYVSDPTGKLGMERQLMHDQVTQSGYNTDFYRQMHDQMTGAAGGGPKGTAAGLAPPGGMMGADGNMYILDPKSLYDRGMLFSGIPAMKDVSAQLLKMAETAMTNKQAIQVRPDGTWNLANLPNAERAAYEMSRATEAGKTVTTPPGGTSMPASAIIGAPPPLPPAASGPMSGTPPRPQAMPQPSGPAMPGPSLPAPSGAAGPRPMGMRPVPGGMSYTNPNSPALVNLTNGNQPAYLEHMGKDVADFVGQQQKSLQGIQEGRKAISDLRKSLTTMPTGPGTESTNYLQQFSQKMGFDLNNLLPDGFQADPTKYGIAQKNITQLATAFAKANFPTRITNNDMQIAVAATPNFGNTPEANKELLDSLDQVYALRQEQAKFYRQMDAEYRGKGQVPGWDIIDKWEQHLAAMPNIKSAIKAAYTNSGPMAQSSDGGSPGIANPGVVTHTWTPNGIVPVK